ncbi:hypothetical protein [Conexibacter arvalis]|uniref:YokE-like PH domain-containing protein n=1 Tax=Conexibacter arvalis TaxID=912552 RepID=A0A840ID23_9ACTN|nr:hypothetical protein [Conexibacter arvalis]MBB4662726.1 hypothetical protein [Conexibacter arvalis]
MIGIEIEVRTAPTLAQRYDHAARELLGEEVLAAAQFLRPRGWRAFGHALARPPVGLLQRARGRRGQVRLPEACLLAVTPRAVHLLQTRAKPGGGPVPRATRRLASWDRDAIDVDAAGEVRGTKVTIAPRGDAPVELYAPPSELTARVLRELL